MGEKLGYWGVLEVEVWRKGPWTAEEDKLLIDYVKVHGEGRWSSVAALTGLKRNGKSCRLRWVNYLRPDLKRGQITPHEESIILELHARWGNRWSTIARSLPGRTDNEIKNYWRTHFKKKEKPASETNCKSKARLMKKKQFQQQLEITPTEMKKTVSLLDENERNHPMPFMPQMRLEVASPYPITIEEQNYFLPLFNGYYNVSQMDEVTSEGNYNLWDGLWNLDDFHGNLDMAFGADKAYSYAH